MVSSDNLRWIATDKTLQSVLDDWDNAAPWLRVQSTRVNAGQGDAVQLDQCLAPLPRAFEWLDGSAFLHHVKLVRQARGAALPPSLFTDPLMYQGGSGVLGAWNDPLDYNPDLGLDMEAELAVITGDIPRGGHEPIRLVTLINDVSLRALIPSELKKGFGFLQSKPTTSFAPFAVTPDELPYEDGRFDVDVQVWRNDERIGHPNTKAMHFSFPELIAHVTATRCLTAGTLVGSGTVSNEGDRGVACLAEARMREIIETGTAETSFLCAGERVRIAVEHEGRNVFGDIRQAVR